MSLDVTALTQEMMSAAEASLKTSWASAESYARPALTNLATSLAAIEAQENAGTITQNEAGILLSIHKNTALTVLLAVQGIGLLAAQNAINAALDAIKATVNAALKFALI